jgi:dTDP-4-dehydrorhamnose reductase
MIWLVGSRGMLGTELSIFFEKRGIPYIGTGREIDITDRSTLRTFIRGVSPSVDWVINCAAYTAVDKAEDEAEMCRRINAEGAENIAVLAHEIGAKCIYFSTDYVFDGKRISPYMESGATNPIGVYGITKRNGEILVLQNCPASYIIRTAWLYGRYGNNFVRTMCKLMNMKECVSVVDDQTGSPTWTFDLAYTTGAFMSEPDIPFGIYHFTDEGDITWFDFAAAIYKEARKTRAVKQECAVIPCTSNKFPAKVKRPAYSVLDKTKIKTALGIVIPSWDTSLTSFLYSSKD